MVVGETATAPASRSMLRDAAIEKGGERSPKFCFNVWVESGRRSGDDSLILRSKSVAGGRIFGRRHETKRKFLDDQAGRKHHPRLVLTSAAKPSRQFNVMPARPSTFLTLATGHRKNGVARPNQRHESSVALTLPSRAARVAMNTGRARVRHHQERARIKHMHKIHKRYVRHLIALTVRGPPLKSRAGPAMASNSAVNIGSVTFEPRR